ncbi:hypothetical protein F3I27_21290 [Pantoea sp. Bo_2]|uniref:ParE family toxin-like protein n=1 Tax=Pantoea TaxID=53335 RepID=UPI001232F0E6|nr:MULTISPECIES: hypothetical protein [Pantoea]KAA5938668.1 hypothetical protein F3I57_20640 [Pantoea sp. VH_3]KAA5946842.1 hypothetical protein F3I56_21590 [Pantoea sp. VH_25]KAA5977635.1 hypothetical protein F3I48_21350 [Pantoea sp. M_3]KAA6041324.1 hypothetical protein F3I36_21170 [Pantoea sp. FN_2b]KAA6045680.1 hypothetical protein F3I34_21300 [Pantoea sp. Bo_5]
MAVTMSGICAITPIYARAVSMLRQYERGARNFSRIKPYGYLVIRVGRRWRLLSKNGGQHWRLMTHETYNNESVKR